MRAFFFGPAERQLYGVFHAAESPDGSDRPAVVLAYPWLAEYNMSHWAFRKLAGTLSQGGSNVLRFDYWGTGDSSGDSAEARTDQWVEDLVVACREVMDLSGAQRVSVVGLGLGASLALKAAERQQLEDVVLWDPVVTGTEYLAELERLDRRQRLLRLYDQESREQLLGHPFPAGARADLLKVDIQRCEPRIAGRALILAAEERSALSALLNRLSMLCPEASLQVLDDAGARTQAAEGATAMLASAPLAAIAAFVRSWGSP